MAATDVALRVQQERRGRSPMSPCECSESDIRSGAGGPALEGSPGSIRREARGTAVVKRPEPAGARLGGGGADGRALTECCACVEWRGFEVRKVVDVGRVAQR